MNCRLDDPKSYLHEVATMGCRTRVYENVRGPKSSVGRGNLSFTSINMPRLAIEAICEAEEYCPSGSKKETAMRRESYSREKVRRMSILLQTNHTIATATNARHWRASSLYDAQRCLEGWTSP